MKNQDDTNQPEEFPRPNELPEGLPWPPDTDAYKRDTDGKARLDETSEQPFNDAVAREAFGDEYVDQLKDLQEEYHGDWWCLAFLRLAEQVAVQTEDKGEGRLGVWRRFCGPSRTVFIHLENANLMEAHLENADLRSAHLENANLMSAHLENAKLRHVHLENANLMSAHLENAVLFYAHLEEAKLGSAHLEEADLRGSHITGCRFLSTNLDNAKARHINGKILFDGTLVKRLDIEGNSRNPWSVLRNKYTGPMYLVNLGLLLIFLLPHLGEAAYLTAVSTGYDSVQIEYAKSDPDNSPIGVEDPKAVVVEEEAGYSAYAEAIKQDVNAAITNTIDEHRLEFDATHDDVKVWKVMIGYTQRAWMWYITATFLMAFYNILRAYLTMQVSILRDQEERVWRTPTLAEYYGLCHPLSDRPGWKAIPGVMFNEASICFRENRVSGLWRLNPLRVIGLWRIHQIVKVILWFAAASFVVRMGAWLLWTQVPVPKIIP